MHPLQAFFSYHCTQLVLSRCAQTVIITVSERSSLGLSHGAVSYWAHSVNNIWDKKRRRTERESCIIKTKLYLTILPKFHFNPSSIHKPVLRVWLQTLSLSTLHVPLHTSITLPLSTLFISPSCLSLLHWRSRTSAVIRCYSCFYSNAETKKRRKITETSNFYFTHWLLSVIFPPSRVCSVETFFPESHQLPISLLFLFLSFLILLHDSASSTFLILTFNHRAIFSSLHHQLVAPHNLSFNPSLLFFFSSVY